MKKVTMNAIVNYINANEVTELYEVRDELVAELNKDTERKAQNADLYDRAKPIVMSELGEQGVTIGELWEAVEGKVPEGFTKGKLQYAITRLWVADVTKTEGKVNTYAKA